jgi:hypothetical protein
MSQAREIETITQEIYNQDCPNLVSKIVEQNEKSKEKLEDVMRDLEEKVNPKSAAEGLVKLAAAVQTNNSSLLLNPMQAASKEFEARVGRQMTYSEMRAMWG